MSGKQGKWGRIEVMAGVCEVECRGRSPRDELLTLTKCPSCVLIHLYEALGWKSVCARVYNLKGIKEKIYLFFFFLRLCFSFTVAHFHGMMRADPMLAGGCNV